MSDSHPKSKEKSKRLFTGFALPTSNTTYTPNQYFDVCLPYQSRGVVRLVGYMIRKTLGWCDEHGNPIHETVAFSYADLEKHAGLSHSMIRLALDEAEKAGFIRCVRRGLASSRMFSGHSAVYELAWDERPEYVKDPKKFTGFFAGEGNRTYIPNQYFDRLVRRESLAMVQIVGAIIRFSIGFQNKFGYRRQQAALSYLDIQRYAKIKSPRILSKMIREAITNNYIARVEDGYFDRNGGVMSRSAQYAVKWASTNGGSATTPKSEAGENHTEKLSGTTPKNEAEGHSEKFSGIQIKQTNNILKQQETSAALKELRKQGFDQTAAERIASKHSAEQILQQIEWIDRRKVKRNRLGMLRAAIEHNWLAPRGVESSQPAKRTAGTDFPTALADIERRLLGNSDSA